MTARNIIWILTLVVITVMLWRLAPIAARQDTLLNRYAPLVEVDALVRKNYVDPVTDKQLLQGALHGIVSTLDDYSSYMTPEEAEAYAHRLAGERIGIGVETGLIDGAVVVIAPLAGGPADRAGIRPGDRILAIDGQPADTLFAGGLDRALTGKKGTTVELSIQREGADQPLTFKIAREPLPAVMVHGVSHGETGEDCILDSDAGIAYIRISAFSENTADQFNAALAAATADNMNALILDLRSNPGGIVPAAVAVVDRFLADGLIVATRTRVHGREEYYAHDQQSDIRKPLVVLINGGTASAAEIVAGSLQDNKRALIVGQRSFGKGSVQYVLNVAGGALRLTSAYYELPSGRIIHRTKANLASDAWGVKPDLAVDAAPSVSLNSPDPIADAQLAAALRLLRSTLTDNPS